MRKTPDRRLIGDYGWYVVSVAARTTWATFADVGKVKELSSCGRLVFLSAARLAYNHNLTWWGCWESSSFWTSEPITESKVNSANDEAWRAEPGSKHYYCDKGARWARNTKTAKCGASLNVALLFFGANVLIYCIKLIFYWDHNINSLCVLFFL